jgi:drug/metabolite transporter (DMT)-like permease
VAWAREPELSGFSAQGENSSDQRHEVRHLRRDLLKSQALLLLTAAIWGFAFVAQRAGMEHVGPFTFNAVRFTLGSLILVPFLVIRYRMTGPARPHSAPGGFKMLLKGGAIAGAILFAGASLQQKGIVYTTAGKAGFITGLYVIIVPVLGVLIGRRPGSRTWLGAVLAVIGLYLLSVTGRFTMSPGDTLVLAGAFAWAGHVIVIGWLSPKVDAVALACIQYAVCSLLSWVGTLATEVVACQAVGRALVPILYAGLLSTGVAYTLQVVAQRRVPAANAAIIMSLEAVFAGIGGWLLLDETLPVRGLVGCALMLAGMMAAQLDRRTLHAGAEITVRGRAKGPDDEKEQLGSQSTSPLR